LAAVTVAFHYLEIVIKCPHLDRFEGKIQGLVPGLAHAQQTAHAIPQRDVAFGFEALSIWHQDDGAIPKDVLLAHPHGFFGRIPESIMMINMSVGGRAEAATPRRLTRPALCARAPRAA
jgi:hypothetical protein